MLNDDALMYENYIPLATDAEFRPSFWFLCLDHALATVLFTHVPLHLCFESVGLRGSFSGSGR
eukprot:2857478-Amphidinium_carterae.1